jgi:serine/threonine protein kinase
MQSNKSDWENFYDSSADKQNIANHEINFAPSQTHYKSVFEEKTQIGRGGFGHVFYARNKYDDEDYAVKKILLSGKYFYCFIYVIGAKHNKL